MDDSKLIERRILRQAAVLEEGRTLEGLVESVLSEAIGYNDWSNYTQDNRVITMKSIAPDRLGVESVIKNLIEQQRLIPASKPDHYITKVTDREWTDATTHRLHNKLLSNIRANIEHIEKTLAKVQSHWAEEDMLYRFYHQSFKVYRIQEDSNELVTIIRSLDPRKNDRPLNPWFETIVKEGTGKVWERSHNDAWLQHARPMLEAFNHAKMVLIYALKYGKELGEAPRTLPSGWALVLYIYGLR